jgi:F0F1-type ATP synthase membrane subunit b/b'
MSGGLNIYPFEDMEGLIRLGVQFGVFCLGYLAVSHYIIKPLFSLYQERQRRSSLRLLEVEKIGQDIQKLQAEYDKRIKAAHEELSLLKRTNQKENEKIVSDLLSFTRSKIEESNLAFEKDLSENIAHQKALLKEEVNRLSSEIYKKIVNLLLALAFVGLISPTFLGATPAEGFDTNYDFWNGVLWPYYQFAIYLGVLIYFARKPIKNLLENKRDDYRAKLTEATQAYTNITLEHEAIKGKLSQIEEEISKLKEHTLRDLKNARHALEEQTRIHCESLMDEMRRTSNDKIQKAIGELKKTLVQESMDLTVEKINKEEEMVSQINEKFRLSLINTTKNELH